MTSNKDLLVPDIGDFSEAEVIEILVAPGDTISAEDSLITLETDKATMEVPASDGGVVVELKVNIGDLVSQGSTVLTLETAGAESSEVAAESPATAGESNPAPQTPAADSTATAVDLSVPDIGDFSDVEIVEVLVAVGQSVEPEESLITVETDKASMEIPSTHSGTVTKIAVEVGDRVSQGDPILSLQTNGPATEAPSQPSAGVAQEKPGPAPPAVAPSTAPTPPTPAAQKPSPTAHIGEQSNRKAYASPSVRRFARELGVDINLVTGSGRKSRILKSDAVEFIKNALSGTGAAYGGPTQGGAASGGMGIPPMPEIDFAKFGPIERVEMSRINKLSATNLHRAWLNVPHVTHHDEADITDLEDFRKSLKAEAEKKGVRVTGLVFHMKALAFTLASFPRFNSSLAPDGESLIYKKYFHIGIAVDTPNGLVVPVFKDVDQKSIFTLSEELMDVSARAREKKLKPNEMQGASMTISSLGGIGGTAFTPIVNSPEAAILGITRARLQPVWNGSEFVPRLMVPLDVSYDHRIVDGAGAARFMAYYCNAISDVRRLLL